MRGGVLQRSIQEMPFAILDCETTGLAAGSDRIIEIAILRREPGQRPRLILDTLVNPHRSVAATEIHGITEDDVADAPDFEAIVGDVAQALSGCVLAAYNVYFDIRFLSDELSRAGIQQKMPYVCLMYLRPMLGLGPRRPLRDVCAEHGITHDKIHIAALDAQAGSQLMELYLHTLREKRIRTFEDLAALRHYKFISSLEYEPLDWHGVPKERAKLKSRAVVPTPSFAVTGELQRAAVAAYWDALTTALADLEITQEEIDLLERKRAEFGLGPEQVRMMHARAFAVAINQFVEDQRLDDSESEKLRLLHQCLSRLGWAPGG
jgi:DNA polymerase-3 subunit epsilon